MEEKKLSVFAFFIKSFFLFKEYHLFRKLSNGKVFLYILLVSFIVYAATFLLPAVFFFSLNNLEGLADEHIPDFTISRDGFYCDREYYFDEDDLLLIIDSNAIYSEKDLYEHSQGFIIDAEKIILRPSGSAPTAIYHKDLEGFKMSDEDVYNFLPKLRLIIVICTAVSYIFYCLSYLVGSLVCTFIAMLINYIVGSKQLFGDLFKLTVYARTLPVMLNLLFLVLGLAALPMFAFYAIFTAIMVYVLASIKNMDGYILASVKQMLSAEEESNDDNDDNSDNADM